MPKTTITISPAENAGNAAKGISWLHLWHEDGRCLKAFWLAAEPFENADDHLAFNDFMLLAIREETR